MFLNKLEIEKNNERMHSRFSDIIPHEIGLTAFDLHRDHPTAWTLNFKILSEKRNRAKRRLKLFRLLEQFSK